MSEKKIKIRPYLSPEFNGTSPDQDTAFKAYNRLLKTVDPERIATALSARALNLLFEPDDALDKKIVKTAEEVLKTTNNGTQIGFGKKSSLVEKTWEIIHKEPSHKTAATDFNTLKYESEASTEELENRCKKRGYATLEAVARIHNKTNELVREEAKAQASSEHALAA